MSIYYRSAANVLLGYGFLRGFSKVRQLIADSSNIKEIEEDAGAKTLLRN